VKREEEQYDVTSEIFWGELEPRARDANSSPLLRPHPAAASLPPLCLSSPGTAST
jgi:hypothetical protein